MGCWCGTCAITQLPINAGDPVRLFFITMQDYGTEKEGAGYCYSNGTWFPRGLPIAGEYDDYGSVENIKEDLLSKILVDGINQDWAPYTAKHEWDKSTVGGSLTIQQIVEETERDRAKIHDGRSQIERDRMTKSMEDLKNGKAGSLDWDAPHPEDRPARPFGFIMVHEDVYQAMIGYDHIDAHHQDSGYFYRRRSEILVEDMKEFYLSGLESYQETKDLDPKFRRLLLSTCPNHWNMFSHTAVNPDPPFCKGISYYWDALRAKMAAGAPYEDSEVQTIANGLIDFYKFSWAMSAARKAWVPQSGKGSQQNELDIYKVIEDGSKKVIRARKQYLKGNGFDRRDKNGFSKYMIEHNKKQLENKGTDAKEGK